MTRNSEDTPSNQNSLIWELTYTGVDKYGDRSRFLEFRPMAVFLIKKYVKKAFAKDENDREFQHLEQHLVGQIEIAKLEYLPEQPETIAWPVENIARALGVSPITLYQDKELPVYLNPNNAV